MQIVSISGSNTISGGATNAPAVAIVRSCEHLCLFYDDPSDRSTSLIPYVLSGLEAGERVLYVAGHSVPTDVRHALEEIAETAKEAGWHGGLAFWSSDDLGTNARSQSVAAVCARMVSDALASGFTGVRLAIDMGWTVAAGVEAAFVRQWEYNLTAVCESTGNLVVLCQYNTQELDPEIVQSSMRTHPAAILEGTIYPSPYYEGPELLDGETETDRTQWMLERMVSHGAPTRERLAKAGRDAVASEERHYAREVEFDRYSGDVNERLRFANRAKDEFLALVSHELRTPLTMILGNADVLERRHMSMSDDTRGEVIGDLQGEAKRLSAIIDHLLVIARLDGGEGVESEPAIPFRIIDSVAEETRRALGRDIRIAGDSTVVVWADLASLRDVFQNLVINATMYSASGTPIEIDVSRDAGRCRICVADRGIGLSESEKTEVFEPFYRSPAVAATQVRGMGIGLTACKRIVEAHQGRIWAEQREGGGSIFCIELPVVEITD